MSGSPPRPRPSQSLGWPVRGGFLQSSAGNSRVQPDQSHTLMQPRSCPAAQRHESLNLEPCDTHSPTGVPRCADGASPGWIFSEMASHFFPLKFAEPMEAGRCCVTEDIGLGPTWCHCLLWVFGAFHRLLGTSASSQGPGAHLWPPAAVRGSSGLPGAAAPSFLCPCLLVICCPRRAVVTGGRQGITGNGTNTADVLPHLCLAPTGPAVRSGWAATSLLRFCPPNPCRLLSCPCPPQGI